jgi:hypothetical protein
MSGKKSNDEYDTSDKESDIEEEIPRKKTRNELFKELIRMQLPNVPIQWKLGINDIKRICKYIDTSIFDSKNCCIWNGYVTNLNNSIKGSYINFYFRNKKVALHRLLYSNFIEPLNSDEYLKFNCPNKGRCCNVFHYDKYKYSNHSKRFIRESKKESKKDKNIIIGVTDEDELTIDFDE